VTSKKINHKTKINYKTKNKSTNEINTIHSLAEISHFTHRKIDKPTQHY